MPLHRENVLLNGEGYAVLTDLGLAKVIPGRTYTCCGTPLFFAPEVIAGKGYGFEFDWWSLGVVFHDLMLGRTPFEADAVWQIYRNIMKNKVPWESWRHGYYYEQSSYGGGGEGGDNNYAGEYDVDEGQGAGGGYFSEASWCFFRGLTATAPHERLPRRKGGMENVLLHPFFTVDHAGTVDMSGDVAGGEITMENMNNSKSNNFFDWAALEQGTLAAPFVPEHANDPLAMVKSLNVDEEWLPPVVRYEDDGSGWEKEF
eukprot:g3103.t1